MTSVAMPALWLILLIAGLPHLSETIYSPSLPDIAQELHTPASLVEYTLTMYLFSFALGTLFWGKCSDHTGRKPCVIAGLCLFILGCVMCYSAASITDLMIGRFVQGFGGSIGSVLGQAIARDAFHGPRLGRVYASIGSALAIFPAIGPILGGLIADEVGWRGIFVCLIGFSVLLSVMVIKKLPETHLLAGRTPLSVWHVSKRLASDKHVWGCAFMVAGCNGINFSYFAEGSFYLIETLGLSPTQYGLSFLAIASCGMSGGLYSKHRLKTSDPLRIMRQGLGLIATATLILSTVIGYHWLIQPLPDRWLIALTIMAQMSISFGMCMTVSNALALSLGNYKDCIGTASSLFGFFYYLVIALLTFGMGMLHNGTLLPMPLYFLSISVLMLGLQSWLFKKSIAA